MSKYNHRESLFRSADWFYVEILAGAKNRRLLLRWFGLQAQQHSFNCPYQLASPTKWPEADTPEAADVYEVELLPGDVVILGSDGLFDNMWDRELEALVAEHLKVRPLYREICMEICGLQMIGTRALVLRGLPMA